jgi:phosphatidylserine/phosphatidylglycerophosphate/cardiolipin synthase-like enzyme
MIAAPGQIAGTSTAVEHRGGRARMEWIADGCGRTDAAVARVREELTVSTGNVPAAANNTFMSTPDNEWWITGDFPVRPGTVVEPLVDGRAAFFAMTVAFLTARSYILVAAWDICAELPLVRGSDLQIGDQDPMERERFISVLRQEGLDNHAMALWQSDHLRVVDVLGFAARRGVRVGVLLWSAMNGLGHITNAPLEQRDLLHAAGVDCLLDDSALQVTHVTEALHQKCAVVDGRVAFVGGIDLTREVTGDYDRWDTHQHPCASAERYSQRTPATHPWHDVHTRITGPAVADVRRNIAQRWADLAARHNLPVDAHWPSRLPDETPAPLTAGHEAQIIRTIPPKTYAFAPEGIAGIKQAYLRALARAQRYIYIENQYLWPEVYRGLDTLLFGGRSPDMEEVLAAMAAALRRGVSLALTLPDHPNCGRRFTDGGVEELRQWARAAGAPERLHVFTLGNSEADATAPGGTFYRPVYTHAKVAIVDDIWWTVGSANLNSRGLHSDAEINVAAADGTAARELRLRLWNEHLRSLPRETLIDPIAGLGALDAAAAANFERVRARALLEGHLLPYLTEADGKRVGVPVHHEHGWLDNLPGGVGAHSAQHADKYI